MHFYDLQELDRNTFFVPNGVVVPPRFPPRTWRCAGGEPQGQRKVRCVLTGQIAPAHNHFAEAFYRTGAKRLLGSNVGETYVLAITRDIINNDFTDFADTGRFWELVAE